MANVANIGLQLAPGWSIEDDATGKGSFLRVHLNERASYVEHPLGSVNGLLRFTSLHRFSPFWTRPAVGQRESELQAETVWLLAQTKAGYALIVPLLDEASRYALRAARDGSQQILLSAETGDPALACKGGVAVYVAEGSDPYALISAGARAIHQHLSPRFGGRLRVDKPLPDFVESFGWCTWDAFYKDVSADKLLAGLASFQAAGVSPRWLILDDGWQTWKQADSGEDRLTSFDANDRFDGDLTSMVKLAKTRFGVQRVLVWHALLGYWGGLDEAAFAEFGVRSVARSFGPGLLEQEPRWNVQPWGAQVGVPAREHLAAFYDRLHQQLAQQGVDGVKVDAQAMLEAVSAGQGGRMPMAQASRKALEASALKHFDGRLINCMSCTPECAYLSAQSTLMRSSDDFFPKRSQSHGAHLVANAMASLWFGEFMQPDWDMFHSAHPRGAFHAAARVVSGGPVYVSDAPDAHDTALLNKLVLSDGRVLRAMLPGRPSPDCLFADPMQDSVLLKIFNLNREGSCGILGLFHVTNSNHAIEGTASVHDVPGLDPNRSYAGWAHRDDRLWLNSSQPQSFTLAEAEWELLSFAPIEHGFAAFGLADKLNSTASIRRLSWHEGQCRVELLDGGTFLAWAQGQPLAIRCDNQPQAFSFDSVSGRLQAHIATGGPHHIELQWT